MLLPSLDAARNYDHIYIAPHLDDAVLSCGGQIALAVADGARVLVVTLCAGSLPADAELTPFAQYLHQAWALGDDPIAQRRAEDAAALAVLRCDGLQLNQLDAPYRVAAYGEPDAWRGRVVADDPLIIASRAILERLHVQQPAAPLYVPLGVGGHVDHQVVCASGMALREAGASMAWYEDAPYAAKEPAAIERRLAELGWSLRPEIVSIGATIERKLRAIGVYASQLRELFGDADMAQVMTAYAARVAASQRDFAERLWR
jgi:LmbE family N-acetylglucosaminyl deacetylase